MKPVVRLRRTVTRALAVGAAVCLGAALVASPVLAAQQSQAAGGQTAVSQAEANGGGLIDRVLVRVGDHAVLHSEFEALLQDRLTGIAAQMPQDQIDAQLPMIRMSIMQGLVEEAILGQQAEQLGITASPNEIDRAIANMRAQYGLEDEAQWQQAMAQSGLNEAQLREQAANSIVQTRMIQQEIARQVFVSQREIATYYEQNPSQFTEPEEVLYQQIVLVYQGADRAPVRERAENALAELRSGGSLTAVATKYVVPGVDSVQDASTAGWISPDDIQQEVRTVIESLTPLAYSDVIEGRFGFHIVQLMDRKEGRVVPLEEVGPQIRNLLSEQKMGSRMQEYTQQLLQDVSLEIYAEEFIDLPNAWIQESQGAPTGPSRQQR